MKSKIILAGVIVLFVLSSIILFYLLPSVNAELGTFKQGTIVDLIQTCNNCTYCNVTVIKYPNGSNIYTNQIMTKDETVYNFTLNETFTDTIGVHKYCYDCGNEAERVTGCIDFTLNLGGNIMGDGQGYILVGIFIVVFGIACIFLYLSNKMASEGLKIFFLLGAFVFLIGSIGIISVVAVDSGLTLGMNKMVSVMLYVICAVFIIMFFYIMLRQTIKALELFRLNKGYSPFDNDLM